MENDDLQALARRHLWLHFSRLGAYDAEHRIPVIERGDGCYVWDTAGRRYLDGLSGLFVTAAGHGRRRLAEAAETQAASLAYFPLWGYGHPAAIRLAARLADLAPADLNRVFFTTGGSEAVESAWKLARQYFRSIGQPARTKVIARATAYHGTTFGALSITGIPALRNPFEPLVPGVFHVPNTNRYRHRLADDEDAFSAWAADAIEQQILMEGAGTVACVYLEPVQNAGGCFPPPAGYFERVRQICDRYGVLLVSDEVICAFGRLGHMFGCDRYGYVPDMITMAKAMTSGYSPLGAVIARDFLAEPFLAEGASFVHGLTFGGHPVSCAVAMANLDLFEEEDLCGNVRRHEAAFEERLQGLRDLPIVGDVRGAGYFWAIELVKGQEGAQRFTPDEIGPMLRGFLGPRIYDAGLIARTDDRGDPIVQLAPPLISGTKELDEIEAILRSTLGEASAKFCD